MNQIKPQKSQNQDILNSYQILNIPHFLCEFSEQNQKNFHQHGPYFQNTKRKTLEQWSFEQEEILYEQYFTIGPKWAYISSKLGKKDNASKNRFYGKIRKLLRRLAFIGKNITSTKRQISYQALIRPVEAVDFAFQPFQNYTLLKNELRKKIIDYSRSGPQKISLTEAEQLIDEIHRFNAITRSYNLKNKKHEISGKETVMIPKKKNKNQEETFLLLQELSEKITQKSEIEFENFASPAMTSVEMMDDQMIEELWIKANKLIYGGNKYPDKVLLELEHKNCLSLFSEDLLS